MHRKKARITHLYFQTHPENQGNYLLKVCHEISPLGLIKSWNTLMDNVMVLESYWSLTKWLYTESVVSPQPK